MKRIVLECQRRGINQAELARRTGTSAAKMSSIFRSKEPPYPLRAIRISRALGWEGEPMELFEEVKEDE